MILKTNLFVSICIKVICEDIGPLLGFLYLILNKTPMTSQDIFFTLNRKTKILVSSYLKVRAIELEKKIFSLCHR